MITSWILSVFGLVLLCLQSTHGVRFSGQCVYKGYAPGAINSVGRSSPVKPAKFETSVMQQTLDYLNTGGGVTAATLGMIDALGKSLKASPQITAVIGIVSVACGFMDKSPSPQDILDKAYESVKLLSEEVNIMMDQMQDYVDAKDLQLERNIMNNNYKELFDRWIGCGEEITTAHANNCQRRAVNALRSARYHFQPLSTEFEKVDTDYRGREVRVYNPNFDYRASAGTWQWMKDECGRRMECLSHDQVKRLEIGIIPFRDYATLHLLALKTLVASLGAQKLDKDEVACGYYKRYLDEMATKADYYVKYAKWAYEWDYIRQYEENDFFGVRGRSNGRPAGAFRGGFLGTTKCSGNKCDIQCTQMFKDNACFATGGSQYDLRDKLYKKCEIFVAEVKKQLNEFWNKNVLNAAKEWGKYANDAKAKLKAVKCSS